MSASVLPVSDAFWIRLNDVVPSGRMPHNSPSRYACRAGSDATAASDRRVFTRPVEPGTGQHPNGTPVEPGVHPVAVVFEFVQPLRPVGRSVDQLRELRFHPSRQRRCLGATPSAERSRHVFRHDALASADRPGPVLLVDLLHDFRPPVHDR